MRHWSRRESLLFAAGAAACAATPRETPTLNQLARAKGLRFGTAMGYGGRRPGAFQDPRYRALVVRECGVLVAENEHKWPFIHPEPNLYTFEHADAMMSWSEAQGIPFRGHNLVWHHPRWLPDWVNNADFGARPVAGAEAMLRQHIATVCAHYGSRIASWDVINETVDDATGAARESVFTRAMGVAANDFMFHVAREAAPHAQLVYNDYMAWEANSATHRAGVLRFLEGLKTRGAPIDALGLQSHIGSGNADDSVGFDTRQEREWRAFLDEVTGMGLDLLITEFDVHDKNLPPDIAARDQAVAGMAKDYLDVTLSYTEVKDVLCWGIVDKYSWLQGNWRRADGIEKRPTPFDDDYKPKPMYDAIAAAFRTAPMRGAA